MADALKEFRDADKRWRVELERQFGKNAGDARYDLRGIGEPMSYLNDLYNERQSAWQAYEATRVYRVDIR